MPKIDIINCAYNTKDLYDEIKKSIYFRKNSELALIFCLAAALGFKDKKYDCFSKAHPGGLFRVSYIEKYTEAVRFIEALAIYHEKSLEILADEKKVYEIAECYANGGIKKLYALVCKNISGADFDKEIEGQINKIMEDYPKN
jgi:hypothetical protein